MLFSLQGHPCLQKMSHALRISCWVVSDTYVVFFDAFQRISTNCGTRIFTHVFLCIWKRMGDTGLLCPGMFDRQRDSQVVGGGDACTQGAAQERFVNLDNLPSWIRYSIGCRLQHQHGSPT